MTWELSLATTDGLRAVRALTEEELRPYHEDVGRMMAGHQDERPFRMVVANYAEFLATLNAVVRQHNDRADPADSVTPRATSPWRKRSTGDC
jgi:hypothetical protein